MPKRIDATGQRYQRLVAIRFLRIGKFRRTVWEWMCDCGKVVERDLFNVRRGDTKSCGCLKKEIHQNHGDRYKLPFGLSSLRQLYNQYKYVSLKKSREFTLTLEDFVKITSEDCFYCGLKPSSIRFASKQSNGHYTYNGIDRTDNSIGYVARNCVPCCTMCNRAKSSTPVEEFLLWAKRLSEFQSKKEANTIIQEQQSTI
jgi:hypothetical protein